MSTPTLREVEVAGIGLTPFGKHLDRSLGLLAADATAAALVDASLSVDMVDAVVFSNAADGVIRGQEMIRGQVALKGTGLEGVPIINTENACASGSAAAHLAWLMVASGQAEIAIAVGAEKLFHADKQRSFDAIAAGIDLSLGREGQEVEGGSVMMGAYAAEARAYAQEYGPVEEALAAIAVKNRGYASQNPNAQFREPITAADVAASRLVADPLRLLTCSPLTDGAAAMVFSPTGASHGRPRVRVAASTMVSYRPRESVVRRSSHQALQLAGLRIDDIDVLQLHDACAFAELIQYEQVGLAAAGKAMDVILDGQVGPGGTSQVNTDGGLMSRGHALGATGLAQLSELVAQLRGAAGSRQVPGATRALSVNSGGWMGADYAASVATALVRD